MPLYDFICDNPDCPTNKEAKPGFELFLTYKDYMKKRDGCLCEFCGCQAKSIPAVPFYGKSNQPEHFNEMVKKRSQEYDKTHEHEPPQKQYSPFTPKGQEIMCKKKGKNIR